MATDSTRTAAHEKNLKAVQEKIAGFKDPFREIGERLHRTITLAVPDLQPKLYYGMPGYARAGAKSPVLVFFRLDGDDFSFGLSEHAHHEVAEDAADLLMPSAWFLTGIDGATERRVAEIVRRAAG